MTLAAPLTSAPDTHSDVTPTMHRTDARALLGFEQHGHQPFIVHDHWYNFISGGAETSQQAQEQAAQKFGSVWRLRYRIVELLGASGQAQ